MPRSRVVLAALSCADLAVTVRLPAEAIDKWFQDLASYEVTLVRSFFLWSFVLGATIVLTLLSLPPQEEMAAASLDQNFTEELSAIEQCASLLLHGPVHPSPQG